MNYRRFFKEHYGIEFGSKYHVHHIDMNHANNDISNLMILPAELHGQYHQRFFELCLHTSKEFPNTDSDGKDFKDIFKLRGTEFSDLKMDALKNMILIYDKCSKWYDYKLFLDGKLPNIHNIHLEG